MTSVRCTLCKKVIASPEMLRAHIKDQHPGAALPAPEPTPPPGPAPSNGLVWEDPPSQGSGRPSTVTLIAPLIPELRRNPGKWARLYTWKTKQAASSAKNLIKKRDAYPDIEFAGRVDARWHERALRPIRRG